MTEMLLIVLAAVGTLGSVAVGVLWGGWSQPMTVLCIMMALDYVSGVVVALVFRKSPKTETGGMSSVIGLKGLLRKLFLILLVAAAYQVDRMIGTNYIRDAVAIAFIANEALSLLENAGLMGIPIPKVLLRGIDVLKGKETAEAEEKPPDGETGDAWGETSPHLSPSATPALEDASYSGTAGATARKFSTGPRPVESPQGEGFGGQIARATNEDGGRPMTAPTDEGGGTNE